MKTTAQLLNEKYTNTCLQIYRMDTLRFWDRWEDENKTNMASNSQTLNQGKKRRPKCGVRRNSVGSFACIHCVARRIHLKKGHPKSQQTTVQPPKVFHFEFFSWVWQSTFIWENREDPPCWPVFGNAVQIPWHRSNADTVIHRKWTTVDAGRQATFGKGDSSARVKGIEIPRNKRN